jgi:hypothetical protein
MLQPAIVLRWRASGLLRTWLPVGLILLQAVPFALGGSGLARGWIAGSLGVGLLLSALVIVGARVRYRRFAFAVDERYLFVQDGFLVKREKLIPVSRMQHVDLERGPLDRLLGLSSLAVYTAGGRGATYRIPGLAPQRGQALRRELLASPHAPGPTPPAPLPPKDDTEPADPAEPGERDG